MKRLLLLSPSLLVLVVSSPIATAAILYESGTLGPTGLAQGSVDATNVTTSVFPGVRVELTQPVSTTEIGGHFVGTGTFFGAIVELDDENDFPDSDDLSTPDVLGTTTLVFPSLSDEVYGDLSLTLDPGWYALVFGSGLFGTFGSGAATRNNPDIGTPSYFAYGSSNWHNLAPSDGIQFVDHRFALLGTVVPEATTIALILIATFSLSIRRMVNR